MLDGAGNSLITMAGKMDSKIILKKYLYMYVCTEQQMPN